MHVADVMTTNVITVQPDTEVREIAVLLLKHRISAVPVVDAEQQPVGIVSEGDLMRRVENETDGPRSWWLRAITMDEKAGDYIKTHGRKASDVMSRNVVVVTEATPLHEVARLLEKYRIKRVPVVRDGHLVGIVSRANLLHGLAAGTTVAEPGSVEDRTIRERLLDTLSTEVGLGTGRINVTVTNGVVELWGIVDSCTEKKAAQVAAENAPGVTAVENHLGQIPAWVWAE